MRRRDDPAGGDQAAGAEVGLSDVNGGHPRMHAWQGRGAAKDPPPGYREPLLVLRPAHGAFHRFGGGWFFTAWRDVEQHKPLRRS